MAIHWYPGQIGLRRNLAQVLMLKGKLDDALVALEEVDPEWATVVKLRYFAGMTVPETAEALQGSPRKVNRQWEGARAWLKIHISKLE